MSKRPLPLKINTNDESPWLPKAVQGESSVGAEGQVKMIKMVNNVLLGLAVASVIGVVLLLASLVVGIY